MTDFKNEFCMHTATCGELRKSDVGREVVPVSYTHLDVYKRQHWD